MEDLATGNTDLLASEVVQNGTGNFSWNTHLETLEVGHAVDFFGEPTTHLDTRATSRERNDVVLLSVELIEQLHTATLVEPSELLALR